MTKLLSLAVLFVLFGVAGCSSSAPTPQKESPAVESRVRAVEPPPSVPSSHVTANDLRAAVARIFGASAALDEAAAPNFIAGDFNGDGYEDVAISIRSRSALVKEDASGLANWTTEDPARVALPSLGKTVQSLPASGPRVHLRSGEELVAVIHGYGLEGWRSPQARQTYLLTAHLPDRAALEPIKNFPELLRDPRFTHLQRDIVCGEGNRCLLWTGSHYIFYPLGKMRGGAPNPGT